MRSLETLALPLDEWLVTLTDGSVVVLYAVGYSTRGDDYVFHALIAGHPNYEIHLAQLPRAAVSSIRGG